MATVVNNPPATTSEGGGSGFLVGIILLIVFVILFVFYGLPYLNNSIGGAQAPQVNVPGKVDVNVNQNKPK